MRWFSLLNLAALAAIGGCAHAQPSLPTGTVVEYHPQETPITVMVPRDGIYTLQALDQPQLPSPVVLTAQAWRGTRIGFHRLRDHSVVAVVGKARFPLPEGTYVWLAPSDNPAMMKPIVPPPPPVVTAPPGPLASPGIPAPPASPGPPTSTVIEVPRLPLVPQPMP